MSYLLECIMMLLREKWRLVIFFQLVEETVAHVSSIDYKMY